MENELVNFRLWSENNPEVLEELKPNLGLKPFSTISQQERELMWQHLHKYFFKVIVESGFVNDHYRYEFFGNGHEMIYKKMLIVQTISTLNEKYRFNSYGINFLRDPYEENALRDFYNIFINESVDVVLELLSIYVKKSHENGSHQLTEFIHDLNDVLLQFGINICLSNIGFIPRQDHRIIEEIYTPVLLIFSDIKWQDVNKCLADAFKDYQMNTPQGYSNSITNAVASVQAFLQILVKRKTGKGEISELISEGRRLGLIPEDSFTKDISSILMQERQNKGIAHPKKEYAEEKHTRMVLNLCMVFFQHCLQ